jgi:hypothetical protein
MLLTRRTLALLLAAALSLGLVAGEPASIRREKPAQGGGTEEQQNKGGGGGW